MALAEYLRAAGDPRRERIAGIVWGCAVADYVGVQVEFRTADEIRARYGPAGVTGPPDPASGLRGLVYDWSDDTDQMVLLMGALDFDSADAGFDAKKFAASLVAWGRHGFPELGDLCGAGIGMYTKRLLAMPEFLTDPIAASAQFASMNKGAAANGAVMRAGIAAASQNFARNACEQAAATHADPRCIASSWLVASLCRHFVDVGDAAGRGLADVRGLVAEGRDLVVRAHSLRGDAADSAASDDDSRAILADYDRYAARFLGPCADLLDALELGEPGAIGYTLKALGCGVWAAREPRAHNETPAAFYKRAVLAIVNRGGDTDTNAAVAGAVLGARVGYFAIGWQERLKHSAWLDRKIQGALERITWDRP